MPMACVLAQGPDSEIAWHQLGRPKQQLDGGVVEFAGDRAALRGVVWAGVGKLGESFDVIHGRTIPERRFSCRARHPWRQGVEAS
jgi:hypothetical protein